MGLWGGVRTSPPDKKITRQVRGSLQADCNATNLLIFHDAPSQLQISIKLGALICPQDTLYSSEKPGRVGDKRRKNELEPRISELGHEEECACLSSHPAFCLLDGHTDNTLESNAQVGLGLLVTDPYYT